MIKKSFVRTNPLFMLVVACVPLAAGAGCASAGPATSGEEVGTQGAELSVSARFEYGWTRRTVTAATTYNSTGNPVVVTTSGTGQYQVRFKGLGDLGGNAQVVAMGTTPVSCSVAGTTASGADMLVNIRCFAVAGGANTDTDFTAFFVKRTALEEFGALTGAYLTFDGSGVVTGSEWSSTNMMASVSMLAPGRYQVKLPGQAAAEGNAQVTAYGNANTHCKVEQWSSAPTATTAIVDCFKNNVADVSGFSFLYAAQQLPNTKSGGYLVAERPFFAGGPYVGLPAVNRVFTPAMGAGSNTSNRLAAATYTTMYPTLGTSASATVLLTANGSGPNYCHPTIWSPAGADEKVEVRCFSPLGGAGDTIYTQMFLRSF